MGGRHGGPPEVWLDHHWLDHHYMHRLVTDEMPPEVSQAERDRVNKRVRRFRYREGVLHRVFADGSSREVPRPAERAAIVTKSHDDAGHFGIKRTLPLVAGKYWWHGIYEHVRLHVRRCEVCARVKASFVPRDIELHPLPIRGMFFR